LYPKRIRSSSPAKRCRLIYRLLYGFLAREGTRGPSEALAIHVHRVDLNFGFYSLGKNKTDDARGWVLGEHTFAALKIWLQHLTRFRDAKKREQAFLFMTRDGGASDAHAPARGTLPEHLTVAGVDRPNSSSLGASTTDQGPRLARNLRRDACSRSGQVRAVGHGPDGAHDVRDAQQI